MPKLTKRVVERIEPDEDKDVFVWDDQLPGFGVRVKASGVRSYFVQYRNDQGRSKRVTIARHGVITVDQARVEALQQLAAVRRGKDPASERHSKRNAPTVSAMCDRYVAEHVLSRNKPRTSAEICRILEKHIRPTLGTLKIAGVSRQDIIKLHKSMENTPRLANHTLSILSKLFNLAEAWGVRSDGTNPCRHVERFKEAKRSRYLSPEEFAVLGSVLIDRERIGDALSAVAAIRLLILTGARKSEILTLRWSHVDLNADCLRLPDSKTGAKIIPLGKPALDILLNIPRLEGIPYVIAGKTGKNHFIGLQKVWERFRTDATLRLWARDKGELGAIFDRLKAALGRTPTVPEVKSAAEKRRVEITIGMLNVRLHDLRHSFASVGAAHGDNLYIIGKVLGHKDQATTARYAHLSDDPVRLTANRIAESIADAMRLEESEVA